VLLVGLSGYLLYRGIGDLDEAEVKLKDSEATLKKLHGSDPFPTIENVKKEKQNVQSLEDGLGKLMENLEKAANNSLKSYPHAVWRENVEVLLVALAVAMGIRTFFLQPFKIPTGSMQPTLFGVTSLPDYYGLYYRLQGANTESIRKAFAQEAQAQKDLVIPTGWARVRDWFEGISYLHVVAPVDGTVAFGPMHKLLIFNISQTVAVGGVAQTMWFPPDYGDVELYKRAGIREDTRFQKGQDVIKMRVQAGDHLFVDRLTYNYRKPTRGEIAVFETKDIQNDRMIQAGDQFYIKRLVALPGDHVQIGNDRHLRINGDYNQGINGVRPIVGFSSINVQQSVSNSNYNGMWFSANKRLAKGLTFNTSYTFSKSIDNNSVEQLMKQVAMVRKSWLFVCGVAGGEQSAMMMTLVSSARRHDLDVGVYVKDVLDQLLAGCTDYDRLLPDIWKQSHPEAIREYRVEERRDKADRKQFQAARRRLAAR